MKTDIRRYLSLRDSLIQERNKLQVRLQEINNALGETEATIGTVPPASARTVARGGRRGARGGLSLREAVIQVIGQGSLTKEEVLEGVQKLGYRFTTKNPMNSLGVILYGKNPKFRNEGGRFSLGRPVSNTGGDRSPETSGQRRKLSPEARERIAAAQRARWAKAKAK